ncbi:hypothetical protein pah_c002o059 [Parachlamydia acanthamoebae str. Hall's coccus]|nr:hypothetical protein pah_c002o059 [Parachlamydia acanthamoebae str. Hall's coccus]
MGASFVNKGKGTNIPEKVSSCKESSLLLVVQSRHCEIYLFNLINNVKIFF